jgi:hypothetical protein
MSYLVGATVAVLLAILVASGWMEEEARHERPNLRSTEIRD